MNIELTSNPQKGDLKIIRDGIQSYNLHYLSEDVVHEEDTKFAVFAKDENGKVVGGVRASAFWNYCNIELLWIAESFRGEGVGRKLIEATEKFAAENRFNYIRTETVSFQARPFYEKLGYSVFGELPNYPEGHKMYCLYKELKK